MEYIIISSKEAGNLVAVKMEPGLDLICRRLCRMTKQSKDQLRCRRKEPQQQVEKVSKNKKDSELTFQILDLTGRDERI